jgi:hypothetical protein
MPQELSKLLLLTIASLYPSVQQLFAHFKRILMEEMKYDILKITIRILSRIFSDKKQRNEEQYNFHQGNAHELNSHLACFASHKYCLVPIQTPICKG